MNSVFRGESCRVSGRNEATGTELTVQSVSNSQGLMLGEGLV